MVVRPARFQVGQCTNWGISLMARGASIGAAQIFATIVVACAKG